MATSRTVCTNRRLVLAAIATLISFLFLSNIKLLHSLHKDYLLSSAASDYTYHTTIQSDLISQPDVDSELNTIQHNDVSIPIEKSQNVTKLPLLQIRTTQQPKDTVTRLNNTVHSQSPTPTQKSSINTTAVYTRSILNLSTEDINQRCRSSLHSTTQQPLGVFVLPQDFNEICELHHFILDGVNHSPCLYREMDPSKAHVWVHDRHRGHCGHEEFFRNETERRKKLFDNTTLTPWKVYFVDYYDAPHLRPCDNLIDLIKNYVQDVIHVKRSIVIDRHVEEGVSRTGHKHHYGKHKVIHIPYGVRSDLVYQIQLNLHQNRNLSIVLPSSQTIFSPLNPVDLRRIGGVRFFWFHPSNKCVMPNPHFECHNGRLRDLVSETLFSIETNMSTALQSSLARSINGEIINASNALEISFSGGGLYQGDLGRQKSSSQYANDLLTYRIVVVTQRDLHEDHYRLMEAFLGGALVFTDLMLAPPKRLIDGEHYIVYKSMTELQEKIIYYLSNEAERRMVALAGWNMVTQNYRSWHMMESVLLREEEP